MAEVRQLMDAGLEANYIFVAPANLEAMQDSLRRALLENPPLGCVAPPATSASLPCVSMLLLLLLLLITVMMMIIIIIIMVIMIMIMMTMAMTMTMTIMIMIMVIIMIMVMMVMMMVMIMMMMMIHCSAISADAVAQISIPPGTNPWRPLTTWQRWPRARSRKPTPPSSSNSTAR